MTKWRWCCWYVLYTFGLSLYTLLHNTHSLTPTNISTHSYPLVSLVGVCLILPINYCSLFDGYVWKGRNMIIVSINVFYFFLCFSSSSKHHIACLSLLGSNTMLYYLVYDYKLRSAPQSYPSSITTAIIHPTYSSILLS